MAANARLQQEVEYRKTVEQQLRHSEILLRNAQRAAQIGCWEFDIQTREVYWTEELFLIHGLDPSQPTPNVDEGFALIHLTIAGYMRKLFVSQHSAVRRLR